MTKKQQSAMEYLMTYGWSILIIAIVLAALFSLGVFSNSSLGPRATPNSCRVYRPNGPGTTTNINLEGVCNGELPQYVMQFSGGNPSIVVPDSSTLDSVSSAMTISLWTNIGYMAAGFKSLVSKTTDYGGLSNGYGMRTGSTYQLMQPWIGNGIVGESPSTAITPNVWHNVIFVYGPADTIYIDGKQVLTQVGIGGSISPTSTQLNIGGTGFNGSIANIQLYNVALDANAVQALYLEGIGGAPIEPQNLMAWWPLDGDVNDYSGNGNNGAPSNEVFSSGWTSSYTVP